MNLADDRVSRHNAMTSGRWIALLGLALTLPSYADSPWIGGPDCGDEIDLRRVDRMLSHRSPDGSDEIFGFYPADCDGGLYLVDLLGKERMWRINESWWLEKLESVAWWRQADSDNIIVTASYITGIGPNAATPFRARIVMTRQGPGQGERGWAPQEPELLE